MKTLIIIDAQNEFSPDGKRPVPGHSQIIDVIRNRVDQSRKTGGHIAWIRHFNRPTESPAFMPGTWGAEFVPGLGPDLRAGREREFQKDVYGAFTGTDLGAWLKTIETDEVEIMGFYTHGCVSTTAREAIMAGLIVYLSLEGTGACAMSHTLLGVQTAEEVRRTALLQLENMGAIVS
ncbi:cysteine hydrolase family protein [Flavitalea flava]